MVNQKEFESFKEEIRDLIKANTNTETVYITTNDWNYKKSESILSKVNENLKTEIKNEILKELKDEIKIIKKSNKQNLKLPREIVMEEPYILGYDDGTFKPDNTITRAEVAEIISNILKGNLDLNIEYENKFKDVNINDWFYESVEKVAKSNIFDGYPDGTFNPQGEMTRVELITVATRLMKLEMIDGNDMNLPKNHWAKSAIQSAKVSGWLG